MGGAALGALARRGEAVAASERRVLRSTMADGCCSPRDGCSAVGGGAARLLREYSPMRGSMGWKRAGRLRAWWVLCALRGAPPCGARTEGHSVVVWVLERPRSLTRGHTRSAPPNPDRTAGAEPPTHSPQPIAPTADGSGAGVAIGDRADLVRSAAPAPSMRSESAVAGLSLQMGWAGRCRRSSAG